MPANARRKTVNENVDLSTLPDAQVIALLASGEHRLALSAYFGEQEYQTLQRLSRRAVKLRPSKKRVYLLPGIMGSTLGTGKKNASHIIWLNPQAIAAGELLSLALPLQRKVQPLSVMLPGYLNLKLRLMVAGFDVILHAFDWRRSVLDTGKQLVERIARDGVKNAMIVGHSMGGLVARAALLKDKQKRIARVVQLGAPNFGSFALVQALRGVYPTVTKIAALDPQHSTDQLVRHLFRTLPGLYELLPTPERQNDLDLLQAANWPDDLLGPDATLLGSAARTRQLLGNAREGCFNIIGVHQETAISARKRQSGLEYAIARDGDGTVPRALAEWPGAATWYVNERHGNLPYNESVAKAIADLLTRGSTRHLQPHFQPPRREVLRWVSDKQLRGEVISGRRGKVEWQQLPIDEQRRILEPVLTPAFHGAMQRLISQ